tara:strand:- start:6755 stop:7324 length:570 start_codon:yes stop_codon:yes gene_type:complete
MCETEITPKIKLHSWMYTLLYPAVLGTSIFAFIHSLTVASEAPGGYEIAFGVFLIFYFSSQHIENTLDHAGYTYAMFFFDVLELVAMFAFYIFLGLVQTNFKIGGSENVTWCTFFAVLGVTFLFPVFSRLIDKKNPFPDFRSGCLSAMSILAAIIGFSGILFGVNHIIYALLCLILFLYFALFVTGVVK